jgi:SSS family solute:Na+ symporter
MVPDHPKWIEPYRMQSIIVWAVSVATCTVISLLTRKPPPEKITDELTINWTKLNIFAQLGDKWYTSVILWWDTSVILWWGLFAVVIFTLMAVFSGLILR